MGRAVEKRRGRREIRGEELEEEFRDLVRERSAIVVVSDNVDSIFLVCMVDWSYSMSSFWAIGKATDMGRERVISDPSIPLGEDAQKEKAGFSDFPKKNVCIEFFFC